MGRRTTAFNNGQILQCFFTEPQVSTTTTGTRTTPTETRTTPTGTRTTPTETRTTPTGTRTTPTGTRTTPTGTRTTPTGTRTTPTTGTHTIFSRTKNRSSNLSFKESHGSEDDEIFDVPSATGFLAWAITCTLAIILIILKKYLVKTFHPCNQCNVESQPLPDTQPTSADTQATAADTQATSADTQATSATSADTQPTSADTQPSVAIPTINTPSHSIATPSSSFYDTPLQSATLSTPSSTTVLVSPPAKNTRSKAKGKVLFKL
ncbi:uncharacterized protein [Magallana gigas]|uniref:uncharacterized protein n=1 Tax=Magallana gigas TaxID=29159 RepID=UPI003341ED26